MKTSRTLIALLSLAAVSAQAELFRPSTITGAVLGGIAGAVIGNNSGDLDHNAWKGAAIGTAAGALLGSAAGSTRDHYDYRGTQVPVPRGRYGYGRGSYYSQPRYGYNYTAYDPSLVMPLSYGSRSHNHYANRGLLWGGLAGAVIGHNSGDLRHNAWRGAALGAGTGLLLGSIADRRAAVREVQPVQIEQPAAPERGSNQGGQTIIINNYYGGNSTPMSSANSMFGR